MRAALGSGCGRGRRREEFARGLHEIGGDKRLGNIARSAESPDSLGDIGGVAITGDEEKCGSMAFCGEALGEVESIDTRHDDVGDHEGERPRLGRKTKRGVAAIGVDHHAAQGDEGGAQKLPDRRLVIYNQDLRLTSGRHAINITIPGERFGTGVSLMSLGFL